MDTNPTVVFTGPRQVRIEEREVPPRRAGQVLIRTRTTLISTGTELTVLEGVYPEGSRWSALGGFPFHPGYDNVGVVVEADEVDQGLVGRTVATYGRHARYVTAATRDVRVVHRVLPDEQAVFFTIAEIVMNGVRRAGLSWGESVGVYGLGLLGQLAARVCLLAGARPIIAVDPAAARLERLPADTSIHRVDPRSATPAELIARETRGRGLDVVFEVTGSPDLIPREMEGLHPQGRFVVLSSPRGKTSFDFHDLCNSPSYTIIGAHNASHPPVATPGSPWTQHRHAELFFDLLADGVLDMANLISHRVPFERAPQMYAALLEDRSPAMGVVLQWG